MEADDVWADLVTGPTRHLGSLEMSGDGKAGVFTVWIEDKLVHFGVAGDVEESRPSNSRQADGVIGRIRKLGQQPGAPLLRRLQRHFPAAWNAAVSAGEPQAIGRTVLRTHAVVRVRYASDSDDAKATLALVTDRLHRILLSDA